MTQTKISFQDDSLYPLHRLNTITREFSLPLRTDDMTSRGIIVITQLMAASYRQAIF